MCQNRLFLLTITVIAPLVITSLPTQSMAANIVCRPEMACVGTQQNDFITAPGLETFGVIRGLGGDDVIVGSQVDDYIEGGAGNDVIYGGEGNDELYGVDREQAFTGSVAQGDDKIDGGNGNDTITGGFSNLITGGPNSDNIVGGYGEDIIYGGPQGDNILSSPGNNRDFVKDIIDCGNDRDAVHIRSSDGDSASNNCEYVYNYD